MLTDPEKSAEYVTDDEFITPRVVKVPLTQEVIVQIADSWSIDGLDARQKMHEMTAHRLNADYIIGSHREKRSDVWRYSGEPSALQSRLSVVAGGYFHPAITQDYGMPIANLLKSYDPHDTAHRVFMTNLMDECVSMQRTFLENQTVETTCKIADNYGVNWDGQLVLLDFSELAVGQRMLDQFRQHRTWERVASNPESTKLPPELQARYNNGCERLFAEDHRIDNGCEAFGSLLKPQGSDDAYLVGQFIEHLEINGETQYLDNYGIL